MIRLPDEMLRVRARPRPLHVLPHDFLRDRRKARLAVLVQALRRVLRRTLARAVTARNA